jgi:hypothetical protein
VTISALSKKGFGKKALEALISNSKNGKIVDSR